MQDNLTKTFGNHRDGVNLRPLKSGAEPLPPQPERGGIGVMRGRREAPFHGVAPQASRFDGRRVSPYLPARARRRSWEASLIP